MDNKFIDALQTDGYFVLRNVVPSAVCDCLREHVIVTGAEAVRMKRRDLFGHIHEARHRHDLKLDLCSPVLEALNSLIESCGQAFSFGNKDNLRIVELAAITSEPGASMQPVHVDTTHGAGRFFHSEQICSEDHEEVEAADNDFIAVAEAMATQTAVILTSLTALQDIDSEMGPTHVWKGTNTLEFHEILWRSQCDGKLSPGDADELLGVSHEKMLLRKGDTVVYDSRTIHCGGANTSKKSRAVLCVSFMGSGVPPEGTTWTMLPSLSGKLSLRKFPFPLSMARTKPNCSSSLVVLPSLLSAIAPDDNHVALELTLRGDCREMAPLCEWQAVAQCSRCDKWRPCSENEACIWAMHDDAFSCEAIGFACWQEQLYSWAQINEAML